ncbi:hypothetical protein [Desulfosporosinus orientis]|nr:hypothetical protein [Desulfosporosinus orientis]
MTVAKDKKQLQEEKIIALRQKVKQLEEDKAKLIAQLVEMEELKQENERLKNRKSKFLNNSELIELPVQIESYFGIFPHSRKPSIIKCRPPIRSWTAFVRQSNWKLRFLYNRLENNTTFSFKFSFTQNYLHSPDVF